MIRWVKSKLHSWMGSKLGEMNETEKNEPLERRSFEVEINGATERIPGLDKRWLDLKKRSFSKYVTHPEPVNGRFILGEKEIWLELTGYVISDLEWLLQQKHHIFWSYMIFSIEAKQLLITFLQEAPPFYMRNTFPKDKEMEKALERIEYLVLLVFTRLSTEKESSTRYVENLGQLVYDNYLFTVPVMLDICSIYGISNRRVVYKMIRKVITLCPEYLHDFREVVPHFTHVLSIVKDKFDSNEISMFNNRTITHLNSVRDLLLHLYDSTCTIRVFLEVYRDCCKLLRTDSFACEVASFYTSVIPKIHKYMQSNDCSMFRNWNFADKLGEIRLNLLSIVHGMFSDIVNDILSCGEGREEMANEYLTKMLEIVHERLFLSDYNLMYPIDRDLRMLIDMCQDMDSENMKYLQKAIAPLYEVPPVKTCQPVTGVELDSLITQVKDILPDLGDGFVEECLKFYDYKAETVIAVLLEDRLSPSLDGLDRNLDRKAPESSPPAELKKIDKIKQENPEMFDIMDDKTGLKDLRERFSQLGLISDDEYNDEYDDTYDGQIVSVRGKDDPDFEGRPFVTPRIFQKRGSEEKEEEDEDDDEEEDEDEEEKRKVFDQFVPNPEEVRAKQEQRRAERARRDCVGRGRGRGQDKQVLANRDFKNTHKSFTSNHNRRKLASRKRNMPLIHS